MINSFDELPKELNNEYISKFTNDLLNLEDNSSTTCCESERETFNLGMYTNVSELINIDKNMISSDKGCYKAVYNDVNNKTVAVVQVDFKNDKIQLNIFGDILPKQQHITPSEANENLIEKAKIEGWSVEDGGVNHFNGNIEMRYKDTDNNVRAAIIYKPDGEVDTVVQYDYKDNKKSQMTCIGQFGQSKTFYDTEKEADKIIDIELDSDGTVLCITKKISNFN